MSTIDDIFAELSRVAARLDALGPEDDAEREELEARREELREQARLAGGEATRSQLEARLAQLQEARRRLLEGHIDVARQSADTAHLGTGFYTMKLNAAIDAAGGRQALEDEIAEVERRLAAMPADQ